MNTTQTNLFIEEVRSWEGVPYKLSGTTRNGVDCSGLIWRGYDKQMIIMEKD